MKMTTGRMWDLEDPNFKVPILKIVIGDDPDEPDASLPGIDVHNEAQVTSLALRPTPDIAVPDAFSKINDKSLPTFELQRGSTSADPEFEWLINGQSFDPTNPLASPKRGSGALWRLRNGGGGWGGPRLPTMEEHRVSSRAGKPAPDSRHPDDPGKEDVVALDPREEVAVAPRSRT